jgi:hypothetical protein
MANTSREQYNNALSLILCARLCRCLAMVLLLWIARHCTALLSLGQWDRFRNGGGRRCGGRNRVPPTLNGHAPKQSGQQSGTGNERSPDVQQIALEIA